MDRKIVNTLLLLFIVLVFYNTLIPFQFSVSELPNAQIQLGFYNAHGDLGSLTDFVGNVVLFLPFGFLFFLWMNHRSRARKTIKTILAAALFSITIELLQLFLPARTTSITDLFLNTLGASVGLLFTRLYLRFFSKKIIAFSREMIADKPLMLLLIVVGILQFFSACMPFLIKVKMSYLKEAISNMRVVPFQTINLANLLGYAYPASSRLPFNWIEFADNFLFWFTVGLLISQAAHFYFYWDRAKRNIIWAFAFLFIVFIEIPQIIIISRVFDVNDVIAAWGAFIAAGIVFKIFFSLQITRAGLRKNLDRIVLVYFVFVIYRCLQPFNFNFAPDGPISGFALRHLIPFYAYFSWTSLWNIHDVLTALFYFLPFSAYFSLYSKWGENKTWRSKFWLSFLIPFCVGIFIELLQAFLPTRVADITDAINFGAGGFIGGFLVYYYQNHFNDETKSPQTRNSF